MSMSIENITAIPKSLREFLLAIATIGKMPSFRTRVEACAFVESLDEDNIHEMLCRIYPPIAAIDSSSQYRYMIYKAVISALYSFSVDDVTMIGYGDSIYPFIGHMKINNRAVPAECVPGRYYAALASFNWALLDGPYSEDRAKNALLRFKRALETPTEYDESGPRMTFLHGKYSTAILYMTPYGPEPARMYDQTLWNSIVSMYVKAYAYDLVTPIRTTHQSKLRNIIEGDVHQMSADLWMLCCCSNLGMPEPAIDASPTEFIDYVTDTTSALIEGRGSRDSHNLDVLIEFCQVLLARRTDRIHLQTNWIERLENFLNETRIDSMSQNSHPTPCGFRIFDLIDLFVDIPDWASRIMRRFTAMDDALPIIEHQ